MNPVYTQVIQGIKDHGFKSVWPAAALAVIKQESDFCPTFAETELLYQENIKAAQEGAGLTEEAIKDSVTITQGPLAGHLARFRFEPGYKSWAFSLPMAVQDAFLMACSIGLGQQMLRWYVSSYPQKEWAAIAQQFMADTHLQIHALLKKMDVLLRANQDNLDFAYRGYNSGNSHSKDPAVIARARQVVLNEEAIKLELAKSEV